MGIRLFSQHLLHRASICEAGISSLFRELPSGRQGLGVCHRHYQTGLDEVEPWVHADCKIEEAATPPSSWYTSPVTLQAELKSVFQDHWLLMGEAKRLQQPGDFISSLVTDRPYVACIDQSGQLQAYHNVCRHHAAAVCDKAHGNTNHFACPYHGWVYGLDGRLQKATKLKGIKNFKASEMGLLPAPVGTWQGFAFVHPGPLHGGTLDVAKTLPHWLGKGGDAMKAAGISLANMAHVKTQHYQIKCNWKVFCDNYLDGGYHVPFAHKSLASGLELESYTCKLYECASIQTCPPKQQPADPDKRLGDQAAAYAFVYPNLMLNRYGPWLDINVVEPTGPETCQVRFEYFLHQDFTPSDSYVAESLHASDAVQQEDVKICESVQRGLRSAAYGTGRYAPSVEQPMFHFHQLLLRDLRGIH